MQSSLGVQEALRAGEPRQALKRLRRVFSPGSWPLALKLSLAGVAAALLPMLSTGFYNLRNSLESVSTAELRNLELLAHSTAGRMAQLITDSQHLEAIRRKLGSLVAANPDIHLVMLMDARGTAVVSSDPEVMGRNFAFREYFKAALAGRPHTSGIVVGAVSGAGGMFFASPVLAEKTQAPIGAVVLRIRASAFDAILGDVHRGASLTPFLIDDDGVVIGHPDPKALYSSLMPLAPARLAEIRADQRFRRNEIASLGMPELAAAMVGARAQGHLAYRSSLSQDDEVLGYAPVFEAGERGANRWVVGVSERRSLFEAPENALFERLLWSVGLVGLLFFGLALLFARTFNVLIDVLRQRQRDRERGK